MDRGTKFAHLTSYFEKWVSSGFCLSKYIDIPMVFSSGTLPAPACNIPTHLFPPFYLPNNISAHELSLILHHFSLKILMPELNPSPQRCLPRFLMGILLVNGLTVRRLYKSFGVKGLEFSAPCYRRLPSTNFTF
jgi:hypothetical protein